MFKSFISLTNVIPNKSASNTLILYALDSIRSGQSCKLNKITHTHLRALQLAVATGETLWN